MLTHLAIQDVVLIDKLSVSFEAGLSVFTGETGAGKSILLDALALALGARSDAGLIRTGAAQAAVTATFEGPCPQALTELLEQQGLEAGDQIILRRTVAKDGKSRAFVNDQPIGVTLLRQIGEHLLEVHGQFETHGLLNPATHRGLLDAFGGQESLKTQTAKAYALWQDALRRHDEAEALRQRAQAEEDFLSAAVAELDDLDPQDGEIERLTERRLTLQNREKVMEALQTAEAALSGERSASSALAQAGKALARIAGKAGGIEDLLAALDRASAEVEEASEQLARLTSDIEGEGETLDEIEERLFRLRAVARKHGAQAERLSELHEDLRRRLALLSDQGNQIKDLAKEVMETRAAYKKMAEMLSAERAKAAGAMAKAVMKELPPLKLERAQFMVQCEKMPEENWSSDGMDKIAFQAATNPGAPAGPVHKIASGGELARFMLALKVVLAKADPVPTLVFDEVDTGIGGATASAVGERLAKLGADVQVLVVTHSPQVAARARSHLHVAKTVKNKLTTTQITVLDETARLEEIARMLAGSEVTDAARKAAQSLLNDSAAPAKSKKK